MDSNRKELVNNASYTKDYGSITPYSAQINWYTMSLETKWEIYSILTLGFMCALELKPF